MDNLRTALLTTNLTSLWIVLIGLATTFLLWPEQIPRQRLRDYIAQFYGERGSAQSAGKNDNGSGWLRGTSANETGLIWRSSMKNYALFAGPVLVLIPFIIGVEVTIAGLIIGYTVLLSVRGKMARRRREAEVKVLVKVAETCVAELRAGAMGNVAWEKATKLIASTLMVSPAARTPGVRAKYRGARATGGCAQVSFENADFARLQRAKNTAEHYGLPMADILDHCRNDLLARLQHRNRTSAALAGPRMTIVILAALPLFGLGLGQAFGAAPLAFLTGGPMGGIVLVIGVAMACAGVLWAGHILRKAEGI